MVKGSVDISESQLIDLINSTLSTNYGKMSQVSLDDLLRLKTILEIVLLISTHTITTSEEDILHVYPSTL